MPIGVTCNKVTYKSRHRALQALANIHSTKKESDF